MTLTMKRDLFRIVVSVWALLSTRQLVRAAHQTPLRVTDSLSIPVLASDYPGTKEKPFTAEHALGIRTFGTWMRVALSPDSRWLAYTVRRELANDARNRFFTPTGAPSLAANCDIWLSDTRTGESKNITEGQGTNWDPVWSPDGKYLSFYSDRGGVARVWLWQRETGESRQLSDAIERSSYTQLEVVRWTPDSRQIVAKVLPAAMTLEDANNLIGVVSVPSREPASTALTKGPTVTVYRSSPEESKDKPSPNSLKSPGIDMNRAALALQAGDLALLDVATGKVVSLVAGIRPVNHWISPDGKYLAYMDFKGIKENGDRVFYDLGLYSFANRSSRILVPDIEQDLGVSVTWSPDSRSLAYINDAPADDSSDSRLAQGNCFVIAIDEGKPRNLTKGVHPPFGSMMSAPLWDLNSESVYLTVSGSGLVAGLVNPASDTIWKASVWEGVPTKVARIPGHSVLGLLAASAENVIWSPDGEHSLVVGTQDEATRQAGFWKIDLPSGKAKRLFEDHIAFSFPQDFALSTEVSRDGQTICYSSEDAQHPQDIWIARSDFSDRHRLTNINPQLAGISFATSLPIEYLSSDGIPLHGALLLPPSYEEHKRYPMIVWLYSGSFMSREVYRFGLESSVLASLNLQVLASHGYAVLVADAPLNMGTPVLDLLKAVMPAVDRVAEMGIADPVRLGVMGHSYGGYSTLALIEQTQRFKVAVDYAGPSDLISYYGHMDSNGISSTMWAEAGQGRIGGTPWEFRDRYIENSPVFFLNRIQTPLLLVHGGLDPIPCQQAEEVFVGLRRLGKEVVYAKYAGEGHVLKSPANVVDFWDRVIAWFDVHLKNPVDKSAIETSKE